MSLSDMIGNPGGGEGDNWRAAEHVGLLCAFVEPERKGDLDTVHGKADATACRYIVVLDGDTPGAVFDDQLVFGNISSDIYANGAEKIVLGRVVQGEAKPGKNPPYLLAPATDAEKLSAGEWFNKHGSLNSVGRILIAG